MPFTTGDPDKLTRQQALIFFYSGMLYWGTQGKDTKWSKEEWEKILEPLTPREIAVVALKEFRDMTDTRVADLLSISRQMVYYNWTTAKNKIIETFGIEIFDRL